MNLRKDFWLSLTVISCFVAIFMIPACVASFLAVANRGDEPAETDRPQRIRADLRAPTLLLGLGSVMLAGASYRRYASYLKKPE